MNNINSQISSSLESDRSPLTVRLFGPMQLIVNGEEIPTPSRRKVFWLLALLILREGREIDRDWLASTLWPESDETQSKANLRPCLSILRKLLGSEANRIQSPNNSTLIFDSDGADIDLIAFDRAIKRKDIDSLILALSAYKGELLVGCFEEWILDERATRERACLSALDVLGNDAMNAGNFIRAVEFYRKAIALDIIRESSYRGLMMALWKSGQRSSAVHSYKELRRNLVVHYNEEPEEATAALYRKIRSSAESDEKYSEDGETRAGRDYTPAALPQPLTEFFGRGREIKHILKSFLSCRMLTLFGAGGIGKTRIALEAAEQLSESFPGGICFVDLAPIESSDMLLSVIIRSLRLYETNPRYPLELLEEVLRGRKTLLILNNCEHLCEYCAELASHLLSRCPQLHILATSRRPLRCPGESLYPILSLDIPPATLSSTMDALEYPVIQLFLDRARHADPTFQLTESLLGDVIDVLHKLDGIPLAIEMAASRLRTLSLQTIASRLDNLFLLLSAGSGSTLLHHQTLSAMLDWSYRLLEDKEKILLQRLSIFAGGWNLEAAEKVCSESPLSPDQIMNILSSLVDHSLVELDNRESDGRYHLLEILKQFGTAKLEESREYDTLKSRRTEYYLRYAERGLSAFYTSVEKLWMNRLETDHLNLQLTIEESLSNGDAETALRVTAAMCPFWNVRGYLTEGRRRIEEVLASCSSLPGNKDWLWVRNGLASILFSQMDESLAESILTENILLARETGDNRNLAYALLLIARVDSYRREEGKECLEESLALWREENDSHFTGICLCSMTECLIRDRDFSQARLCLEEAMAISSKMGDTELSSVAFNTSGDLERAEENLKGARNHFEQSLKIQREAGYRFGIANTLRKIGWTAYDQGDYDAAEQMHSDCLKIYKDMGDPANTSIAIYDLGLIAGARGEFHSALELFHESLAIAKSIHDVRIISLNLIGISQVGRFQQRADLATDGYQEFLESVYIPDDIPSMRTEGHFLEVLACMAAECKDIQKARDYLDKALEIKRNLDPKFQDEDLGILLAMMEAEEGKYEKAWSYLRANLEFNITRNSRRVQAFCLEAMAELAIRTGEDMHAVTLLGMANKIREETGYQLEYVWKQKVLQFHRKALSTLGREIFEAAYSSGAAMSPEEVYK